MTKARADMPPIQVEQALFYRRRSDAPALQARSPGFRDEWLPEAERLGIGFGERPFGVTCPLALFALPLARDHVAVVRASDQKDAGRGRFLAFHLLVLRRAEYEQAIGDPFALADRLPASWVPGELPALTLTEGMLPPRTVADVQKVLRRVKAAALRDDEDPESPDFRRTVENSESPALLGGAQVLVDGGRLVFERPAGDLALMAGLWTLLPHSTRGKIWPASFAFSNELGFDAVVLPRVRPEDLEGYTTEEQAADYPPGSYELALQSAAEAGDQRALDAVFHRRNSGEVLRLAGFLLAAMMLIVLMGQLLGPREVPAERASKAAAAAGVVAVGDPWMALGMIQHGDAVWVRP